MWRQPPPIGSKRSPYSLDVQLLRIVGERRRPARHRRRVLHAEVVSRAPAPAPRSWWSRCTRCRGPGSAGCRPSQAAPGARRAAVARLADVPEVVLECPAAMIIGRRALASRLASLFEHGRHRVVDGPNTCASDVLHAVGVVEVVVADRVGVADEASPSPSPRRDVHAEAVQVDEHHREAARRIRRRADEPRRDASRWRWVAQDREVDDAQAIGRFDAADAQATRSARSRAGAGDRVSNSSVCSTVGMRAARRR